MKTDISKQLEKAVTLADIFELVKRAVELELAKSRGGLMLGLANLGNSPGGFFGAFFAVGTNIIVMNKLPMLRIKETRPELYKPYAFHVLLHEYLHSLGYLDESQVRQMAYDITKALFGEEHLATQVAAHPLRFIPNLAYPNIHWQPEELDIELVQDFDRGSVGYIG